MTSTVLEQQSKGNTPLHSNVVFKEGPFSKNNIQKKFVDRRKFSITRRQQYTVQALTNDLLQTYKKCNMHFKYSSSLNPRRVLTKPSDGISNDGVDNSNADYILYVNDILGSIRDHEYQVMDMLGSGTFGQVVKCVNLHTKDVVAIKVVKNKSAYFNQGLIEIQLLEMLNHHYDAQKHHLLRLLDYFVYRNHLCIVSELLSVNLYELIKQNQFRGLSMTLIRVFVIQILDALAVLNEANVIHCDLKPENILLENLTTPNVKIIDFGSACFENQTLYTYIQSRFYRSPEVMIGLKYDASIDMWSLGCIVAELFLGLPIFPGSSEYNQLYRIVDMLGDPPAHMTEKGTKTHKFFARDTTGVWKLKSPEQYAKDNNIAVPVNKKYFKYQKLPDIIQNYLFKDAISKEELAKEKENRVSFLDFLHGLLKLDPAERWTPEQAKGHPFITGLPWTGPYMAGPKGVKILKTTPKVIPWGIQNASLGSTPQSYGWNSGEISGSMPNHFGRPNPLLSGSAFSSIGNSFGGAGGSSLNSQPNYQTHYSSQQPQHHTHTSYYIGGQQQTQQQQQQQQQQQMNSNRRRSKSELPPRIVEDETTPNSSPNVPPKNNNNNKRHDESQQHRHTHTRKQSMEEHLRDLYISPSRKPQRQTSYPGSVSSAASSSSNNTNNTNSTTNSPTTANTNPNNTTTTTTTTTTSILNTSGGSSNSGGGGGGNNKDQNQNQQQNQTRQGPSSNTQQNRKYMGSWGRNSGGKMNVQDSNFLSANDLSRTTPPKLNTSTGQSPMNSRGPTPVMKTSDPDDFLFPFEQSPSTDHNNNNNNHGNNLNISIGTQKKTHGHKRSASYGRPNNNRSRNKQ